MKVIFLDFDGVILTLRTCMAGGQGWTNSPPDYPLMLALKRMGEKGVRLVISSTHREFGEGHCFKILDHFAPQIKLTDYLLTDWRTGVREDKQFINSRPSQIAEWLSRHPEVTDYRILDDEHWNWTEDQRPKWARCHPHHGLMSRGLIRLLEWSGVREHHSPLQDVAYDRAPHR
jgi:hypothetical protein